MALHLQLTEDRSAGYLQIVWTYTNAETGAVVGKRWAEKMIDSGKAKVVRSVRG